MLYCWRIGSKHASQFVRWASGTEFFWLGKAWIMCHSCKTFEFLAVLIRSKVYIIYGFM